MGWLAGAAAKVAGAISLKPWLLAAAAAAVVALTGFAGYAGMRYERAGWLTAQLKAVERARATERAGAAIANVAEAEALAAERKQREKADETIDKLRRELARKPARCPVSRAAQRLLDGVGEPAAPRAAAGAEAETKAVAADADAGGGGVECTVVVENCAWNRLNVCEPNAQQVEGLQRFYDKLRERYNRP
jgi:hypothetical protein